MGIEVDWREYTNIIGDTREKVSQVVKVDVSATAKAEASSSISEQFQEIEKQQNIYDIDPKRIPEAKKLKTLENELKKKKPK